MSNRQARKQAKQKRRQSYRISFDEILMDKILLGNVVTLVNGSTITIMGDEDLYEKGVTTDEKTFR